MDHCVPYLPTFTQGKWWAASGMMRDTGTSKEQNEFSPEWWWKHLTTRITVSPYLSYLSSVCTRTILWDREKWLRRGKICSIAVLYGSWNKSWNGQFWNAGLCPSPHQNFANPHPESSLGTSPTNHHTGEINYWCCQGWPFQNLPAFRYPFQELKHQTDGIFQLAITHALEACSIHAWKHGMYMREISH